MISPSAISFTYPAFSIEIIESFIEGTLYHRPGRHPIHQRSNISIIKASSNPLRLRRESKKKTPALLHGVFRRGENAPVGACLQNLPILSYTTVILRIKWHKLLKSTNPSAGRLLIL